MSSVYQEKPNIVKVVISDESGEAERFVVGKDLSEVIAIIEPDADGQPRLKKVKRARRTKAEIAATVTTPEPERETATAGAGKKETSWP
jgi:hypothetical protein